MQMMDMDPGTPPPARTLAATLTAADLTSHQPFVTRIMGGSITVPYVGPSLQATYTGELYFPLSKPDDPSLRMLGDMEIIIDFTDYTANNNITGTVTNLNVFRGDTPLERLDIENGQMVVSGRDDGRQRTVDMRIDGAATGAFGQDTVGTSRFILSPYGQTYRVRDLSESAIAGNVGGVITGHHTSNSLRAGRFFLLPEGETQPD
ncbi:hypothetical protein [Yoonia sp. 208BN28-4]|uniref:hypothetical protein n=1 Tax=Yoonia sp. 208BN28-4 TaxID=3126505 RepID=UPI0030AE73A9